MKNLMEADDDNSLVGAFDIEQYNTLHTTGLTQPCICTCPKPQPGFPTPCVVLYFHVQLFEVVVVLFILAKLLIIFV